MIELNLNTDTAVQLIVGVGSTVLALLLMLIKIPKSDYSEKLAKSKLAIVVSFLICSFMMLYTVAQYDKPFVWNWQIFTMLVIYIVVHFSTVIISYSMTSLLNTERRRYQNLFLPGLFCSAVIVFMLLDSFRSGNMKYFLFMCITSISAFLIQSVTYIAYFDKAYKQSIKEFESYYDDEADHKLKWVKFCYVISMLTNLFVLVYAALYWILPHKMLIANLYTGWYMLYMLYLTSNFLSFLGSHKLVLDAFAYKTLSGQEIMRMIEVGKKKKARKSSNDEIVLPENTEAAFVRLEKALDRWVADKRYREYDKTRDEIAKELHTSKDLLHIYFATRVGADFRTWRTNLRIEESKKMLLENRDASINIIAEACGFSDKSNFHRQFVKIVGCSPKEWRDRDGKVS